ncbi:hypothetical protein V3C99_016754 [Haemonchus contortus]
MPNDGWDLFCWTGRRNAMGARSVQLLPLVAQRQRRPRLTDSVVIEDPKISGFTILWCYKTNTRICTKTSKYNLVTSGMTRHLTDTTGISEKKQQNSNDDNSMTSKCMKKKREKEIGRSH